LKLDKSEFKFPNTPQFFYVIYLSRRILAARTQTLDKTSYYYQYPPQAKHIEWSCYNEACSVLSEIRAE